MTSARRSGKAGASVRTSRHPHRPDHHVAASVRDEQFEWILAVILVVLVIFGFLRSARATVIPLGAAVAGRHLRSHVSARLQPEQSHAHGARHRVRLGGRWRHRDEARTAARGRAARLPAGRVHGHLAHDLAHLGPHSAPLFENWRTGLKWQRLRHYETFAEMIDRHWGGRRLLSAGEQGLVLGLSSDSTKRSA
jgi:hypothetical protein